MLTDFNWLQVVVTSPTMIVLIGYSVVTLGVALERVHYYWKRRGDADQAALEVIKRVKSGQVQEATWTCEHTAHPMGVVCAELLRNLDDRAENVEERLHVALSQQKLLLERNLNVLGTVASTAPFVGLMGTVWGIMRAFQDMALAGSAAPSVVAAGVAEALVTTAAGLVIAVPALILYNHFARKVTVTLTVAENHVRKIRASISDRAGDGDARGETGPWSRQDAARKTGRESNVPQPASTR